MLARDGVQEARVQVNPVELGAIAVQIKLEGSNAQVHLVVDSAMTRELLEQAMPNLAAALRENRLAGAAIDVFPVEPKSNDEEFISPLREFDNCILTPHVGGSTMEAQRNIGIEVSEKLVRYSDNGSSFASVNFPEVSLPAHPGKHRLLHIHENVPGVLSQINSIFSENGINISSQYLQTNDKVGYVVMDVDVDASELALARLNEVNGTIKSRVLF